MALSASIGACRCVERSMSRLSFRSISGVISTQRGGDHGSLATSACSASSGMGGAGGTSVEPQGSPPPRENIDSGTVSITGQTAPSVRFPSLGFGTVSITDLGALSITGVLFLVSAVSITGILFDFSPT